MDAWWVQCGRAVDGKQRGEEGHVTFGHLGASQGCSFSFGLAFNGRKASEGL